MTFIFWSEWTKSADLSESVNKTNLGNKFHRSQACLPREGRERLPRSGGGARTFPELLWSIFKTVDTNEKFSMMKKLDFLLCFSLFWVANLVQSLMFREAITFFFRHYCLFVWESMLPDGVLLQTQIQDPVLFVQVTVVPRGSLVAKTLSGDRPPQYLCLKGDKERDSGATWLLSSCLLHLVTHVSFVLLLIRLLPLRQ